MLVGTCILFIIIFIRPYIPTVMYLDKGGFGYQRRVDLLNAEFLNRIDKVLTDNNLFHFKIGKIVFVTTFLYYDKEAMWHYTNDALPLGFFAREQKVKDTSD